MSVKSYIENDEVLSQLNFITVYQAIIALMNKGLFKASDLK